MTERRSQESPRDGDRPPPTVIYVMGAGRSGSTILGVALGNCPEVFYAGELEAWLRRAGIPNFRGEARARFWRAVGEQVVADDLFGDESWRALEYSLALFRVRGRTRARRLRSRYRRVCEELYSAVATTAGVTCVVDTSHYPLRARELRGVTGIRVVLIYLTRNPVSVVASFGRKDVTNDPKSVLGANAYLMLTHLLSSFVFLRHPADRRLLVRYEDFVEKPDAMLRKIAAVIGIPAPQLDLARLATGIPFQGNRLLESDQIALHPGGLKAAGNEPRSYLTWILQSPWSVVWPRLQPNGADPSRDA
jgi:hypothetical protein